MNVRSDHLLEAYLPVSVGSVKTQLPVEKLSWCVLKYILDIPVAPRGSRRYCPVHLGIETPVFEVNQFLLHW